MAVYPGDSNHAEIERGSESGELVWDEIDRPGCYLQVGLGGLVRVPASGLTEAGLPVISIVSLEPLRLVRISDNPAEPITVLRAMAKMLGYSVGF